MIGQVVSRYRILEQIGRGGMGVVYKAQDTQLGRLVALKFLPPLTEMGEEAIARFEREAHAASRLNHPNILTLYEFGKDAGRRFMATEFVEGESLRTRLQRGPLDAQEAAGVVLQVASALATAHEGGIVHRDIKPENIMLRPDGVVKLLDFGLAKLIEPDQAPDATRTKDGWISQAVTGTLPYMSPEQLGGGPVDRRSDLYSVGVMLYEMTTGQRPFKGAVAPLLTDAIFHQTPVPPRGLNPAIPEELERVTLALLEKAPERRCQSARELAGSLRQLSSGVVSSGPTAPAYGPNGRRSTLPLTAAVLGALALAGVVWLFGGDWYSRLSGTPSAIRSIAVLPLEDLSSDAEHEFFTDGMTDELIGRLSKITALRVISRTSAMQYKGSHKGLAQIARELGVDAVVEGSVLRSGNRVRINAKLIEVATERQLWSEGYERDLRDVLALQSEVARAIVREIRVKVAPDEHLDLREARPVSPDAYDLFLRGRAAYNRLTPDSLQQAAEYFQQAIDTDPTYALAHAGLADALVQLAGRARPPDDVLPAARAAALRAIDLDGSRGDGHASLGQVQLFYEFDWAGAGASFRRAAQLNTGSPVVHQFYGLYLASAGRLDEALEQADRAVDVDPLSAAAGCVRARILYYARRYDEAIAQFNRTLDIVPTAAGSCAWLGHVHMQMSRLPEAIAAAKQATASSPSEGQGPSVLARTYVRMGRPADAQAVIQALIDKSRHQFVSPYNIGVAYIDTDNAKALDYLEQAYAERAGILCYVNVDPAFDPLRSHPRFRELVRRLGIPSSPGGRPDS